MLITFGIDKMKILSIDAWVESEGGYIWNNWFNVGTIDKADFELLKNDADYIKWFYDNGYTNTIEGAQIDDDGYNIVICDASNGMPVFAIEYGPEY